MDWVGSPFEVTISGTHISQDWLEDFIAASSSTTRPKLTRHNFNNTCSQTPTTTHWERAESCSPTTHCNERRAAHPTTKPSSLLPTKPTLQESLRTRIKAHTKHRPQPRHPTSHPALHVSSLTYTVIFRTSFLAKLIHLTYRNNKTQYISTS